MKLGSGVTATREEMVARNGMIAAGHRLEAEAGAAVLQKGGNAVDAAVAAAFVAEMAEPAMCGIGAHGVMSVHWSATGEKRVIDFYDITTVDPTSSHLSSPCMGESPAAQQGRGTSGTPCRSRMLPLVT